MSSPGLAYAGHITLDWDPSPDAVAGYTVYYGTSPGSYTGSVNTTQTTVTIQGLPNGVRHYFVVKAFSAAGLYSAPSNEVNGIPANQAPTITNPGDRSANTGAFSLPISAADADGDALTFSASGLPAGLSINASTGQIGGTVSAAGTFAVAVTVTDGALQARADFTLTFTPVNRAPSITNPGSQSTKTGPFSLTIAASDPDGDTLSYSATGLPSGLTIGTSTGTISGSVSTAGTYSVTVRVSDGSLQASATFTLTVNANRAPALQTPGNQSNDLDDAVSLQLSGSDPDGDALTYSATGLPPGLAIAAATGRISGTPATLGTYSVTVRASDGELTGSATFTWTIVLPPPPAPATWWTFNEGTGTTAADSAGSRGGTLMNGAGWTAGRFGMAAVFDGTNDYVSLPTFSLTGGAMSIAVWVRVATFAPAEQRFLSKTTGSTEFWTLGTSGSTLRFRLRTGSSTATLTPALSLPANTWIHVVATYDGARMRLYLNGAEAGSVAKTGTLATSGTAAVNIGRSPAGTAGASYLNGAIDDVRLFQRALTAAEISALYAEAPALPSPPPPFTDDPLVPGTHTAKLVHITELRSRIDVLRQRRQLAPASWTPLTAGSSMIRASHIAELRTALNAVYAAWGRPAPAYTDPTLSAGMPIRAAHLMELRAAVKALE